MDDDTQALVARLRATQHALAEVLLFVGDAENTAPGIRKWHEDHGAVIREAAELFGKERMLSDQRLGLSKR